MQPMPYYQQGYQQPYPPTGSPAASSVMSAGPGMVGHPNGLPPLQHPMDMNQNQAALAAATAAQGAKRKQVKNACTNCQKACKKCDDSRPCPRCVKYGVADTCVNSVRKERKKGIKRGPYKRRLKGDSDMNARAAAGPDTIAASQVQPQAGAPAMRYQMSFGYPTNLNQYGQPTYDAYSQYAAAYHKDQMMPYVNPVYPSMYPVMAPNPDGSGSAPATAHVYQTPQQHQQQQHHQQQQQAMHYPNGMMHPGPQPPRPDQSQQTLQQQQSGPPPPPSQRGSPHPHDPKDEVFAKPQPMTPVPSTSTSSNTASSADSAEDDDGSKFARLSQLCSAALNQTDSHA
ncbi:Zn(2)-C6 fungal-specific transcription factor [Phycomyces blakesleeanus NRRL 1555(-)]|uniref:Zn(2)-C6 fungal-specific transcription factor n=1 Tax=Phycomyces blakesleeanus (strain ATCC 8743b / DSM 1359 / FGSC 10004 / NBRC 33097 / NRRL 1555) TaxID=763407 RepID=A0A167N9N6_PHYB8|nr:Zn(2)-C6 fungal-specific transcription factor [Phycomyces blakesleeanus NRRL 1555(-)]OAD75420.1 Zn(2)-C6 fungal-specific transcription factor [Phycomyces blakesleeanus NRRL 1555(-)]|eukprot:XP_018293460.1 Zn(2)-C6 fungal-specific transcription factor [Phycomyces blakesleeanus NRRL 1555(-)]